MSEEKPKQTGGDEDETADKDKVEKQSVIDDDASCKDTARPWISDDEDKAVKGDKTFDDKKAEKKKQNSDKDKVKKVKKKMSDVPANKSSSEPYGGPNLPNPEEPQAPGDPYQDRIEHLTTEVGTLRQEFSIFRNGMVQEIADIRNSLNDIADLMRNVLHQMRPAGQASGDIAMSASSRSSSTSAAGVRNVFSDSQHRNTNRSDPDSENLAIDGPMIDSGFVQSDSGSHLSAGGRHSDHGSDGSARGSNA